MKSISAIIITDRFCNTFHISVIARSQLHSTIMIMLIAISTSLDIQHMHIAYNRT